MCAEACSSIQRLLRECAEKAGALDEEVRGLEERNRAEEDALRGAATGAAHAEMGALRNERHAAFSRRRARVLAERAAEGAVASPTLAGGRSCVCVGGCGASLCICARTPFLAFASLATLRAQCDSLSESVPAGVPNVSVRVLLVSGFRCTPSCTGGACRLAETDSEAVAVGALWPRICSCSGLVLWTCALCSPATDCGAFVTPPAGWRGVICGWWGTATTLWALFATRVCTTPPSFVDFSLPNSCGRGVCWRAGKPDASPVWGDRERVPEACGETRCRCV
ncbi:hypothetical protein BCY84_03078 [Trypanosoma cruzi cruzi]|nr:hypothetical protein BCY84_03078 [Trypanosoma cruzi cruzi]